MFEYKAVPFLAAVKGRDAKSAGEAAAQLTAVINGNAVSGWELYQLASVNVEVRPGCLGLLTGGRAGTLQVDELIFRRERPS